ncbi:ABC transporter ATP-binding protein [Oerskovia paurometabola]|uniref:ABC transporter ATP-binding protein n=1 Tax=Oerskovia paurometabola TaxID=162170 RepID=UPI00342A78E6
MRLVLTAAAFLLGHAWRIDPRRLLVASVLLMIGYLAAPLVGVALGAFTGAALDADTSRAMTLAVIVVVLLVAELMLGHFAHLSYFEVGELEQMALTDDIVRIVHGGDIARLDDPSFTQRVTTVTEAVVRIRGALESTLQLAGMTLQVVVTTVILGVVEPWLLLLPLAAVPPVLLANRAQKVLDVAREGSAPDIRLARHLVTVGTSGASAKEIRLFGARHLLAARHHDAWARTTATLWTAHRRSAVLRAVGQVWFALAYAAAVLVVVSGAASGSAAIGQVVLVVTLAIQVSVQVSGALGLLGTLQGAGAVVEHIRDLRGELPDVGLGASRQQAELEDTVVERGTLGVRTGEALRGSDALPAYVPERLHAGIRLENITFTYPGASRPVLDGVTLDLPAGATVALVGDNGAGKSTLVKLLCGLYRPTGGRILVDGVDLADIAPEAWHARVTTLFQDFARLQLAVRDNVGVGDLPHLEDDAALWQALGEARARKVVEGLPDGLDQVLGHAYRDGVDLSGGQWQTLGLARTLLRPDPLLLVLDEPASALDATAEHALFERFTASAERAGALAGGVTLFVSHRFSTVRDADRIVVLDAGRVREEGTHEDLVAEPDLYAELFALQAAAYR